MFNNGNGLDKNNSSSKIKTKTPPETKKSLAKISLVKKLSLVKKYL
jgi:hypothetical protein